MNDNQKANYIIELVSNHFGITLVDLKENRNRKCSDARKIAIGLIRKETRLTTTEIGILFRLHHTTVLQSLKSLNDLLYHDFSTRSDMLTIETKYLEKRLKNVTGLL